MSPPLTPFPSGHWGQPPHLPWVRKLQAWHTSGNGGTTTSCMPVTVLSSLPARPQPSFCSSVGQWWAPPLARRAAQEALRPRTKETPQLPLCDFREPRGGSMPPLCCVRLSAQPDQELQGSYCSHGLAAALQKPSQALSQLLRRCCSPGGNQGWMGVPFSRPALPGPSARDCPSGKCR